MPPFTLIGDLTRRYDWAVHYGQLPDFYHRLLAEALMLLLVFDLPLLAYWLKTAPFRPRDIFFGCTLPIAFILAHFLVEEMLSTATGIANLITNLENFDIALAGIVLSGLLMLMDKRYALGLSLLLVTLVPTAIVTLFLTGVAAAH